MMRDAEVMSEVVRSNVAVHTRLADSYDREEPHFRPENAAKVQQRLRQLVQRLEARRVLDVGCGTGFIISLLSNDVAEIHGIDPTQAMLERVDTSTGNVKLHEGVVEHLPFADASFDLVTAYSVLHHLADHRPALLEIARVLRPGGVFYVDLEPNRSYWRSVKDVETTHGNRTSELDAIVSREIRAVLHVEEDIFERFGIDADTFRSAEYIKSHLGGFDPAEFSKDTRAAGFTSCEASYEWFPGQAVLMHGSSPGDASTVETHLRRLLPMSASLFKYLRFEVER